MILIEAWYTDPDLNALNLTATAIHNNHPHSIQLQHTTPNSTNVTTSAAAGTRTGSGKFSNENDSECSSVTSDSMPGG